jgi:hypothetical protein
MIILIAVISPFFSSDIPFRAIFQRAARHE